MCYGLSICRFKVSGFPCFCKMMNYPPMRIYNQCKSLCVFIHQPSVLMLELVLLILQLVLNCNLRQKPPVFFPCLTPQNSHKGRRHEHEPSTCPPPHHPSRGESKRSGLEEQKVVISIRKSWVISLSPIPAMPTMPNSTGLIAAVGWMVRFFVANRVASYTDRLCAVMCCVSQKYQEIIRYKILPLIFSHILR